MYLYVKCNSHIWFEFGSDVENLIEIIFKKFEAGGIRSL